MKGIVRGDDNATAEAVVFYHPVAGFMQDVYSLSYRILRASDSVEVVGNTIVDTIDEKLSTGRYRPTLATDASWSVGTHIVEWTYEATDSSGSKKYQEYLEVLDPQLFLTGTRYNTYVPTSRLLMNTALANVPVGMLQQVAADSAAYIESNTHRVFHPEYVSFKHDGVDSRNLPISLPIIGIESVYTDYYLDQDPELLEDYVVYARHLQGLRSPDDRDAPQIELFETDATKLKYGNQNIIITGVFGYTEHNGTPVGTTPPRIMQATSILSHMFAMDPLGIDNSVWNVSSISEAETRDQRIKFNANMAASEGGQLGLSGNKILDDIIIAYKRPMHLFKIQ